MAGLYPYTDVAGFPRGLKDGQRLGDALVMPPKATTDWFGLRNTGGYMPGETGTQFISRLAGRWLINDSTVPA